MDALRIAWGLGLGVWVWGLALGLGDAAHVFGRTAAQGLTPHGRTSTFDPMRHLLGR